MFKQTYNKKEKDCARTIIILIFIAFALAVYDISEILIDRSPNLQENIEIYISGTTGYNQVVEKIIPNLKWKNSFKRKALERRLENNLHTGYYHFEKGLSTNYMVAALKNGWQSPVRLTIAGTIRTKGELAGIISRKLMVDSIDVADCIGNIYEVLPDTYQVYWDQDAESLIEMLRNEWDRFWKSEPDFIKGINRDSIAAQMGLSRKDVSTIASIVNQESNHIPEYEQIAGVYVNRLKCGMPLQADPTVKFAVGDFTLTRILKEHLLMIPHTIHTSIRGFLQALYAYQAKKPLTLFLTTARNHTCISVPILNSTAHTDLPGHCPSIQEMRPPTARRSTDLKEKKD